MRDILDRIRKACRDCIIYKDGSKSSKLAYSRLNKAIEDYHAAQPSAHQTGLNVAQKEEVRQMIQSALDTGSA